MRSIWKYALGKPGQTTCLKMPLGARVLCVQTQDDEPCLWAQVDPDEHSVEDRLFVIMGTGWSYRWPAAPYIGTYQTDDGEFVWHVLEVTGAQQYDA